MVAPSGTTQAVLGRAALEDWATALSNVMPLPQISLLG